MAYTNEQKADFYLQKYNEVYFSPELSKIYWDLHNAYKKASNAVNRLQEFRRKNPRFKINSKPLP